MRIIAVAVLLLGLLMLLGMSFLRINNLEYDVGVLAKDVQKLKASAAAGAPVAPLPVAEPTAAPIATPATPPPPVPAAAGLTVPVEAVTRGFLDEGAEQQVVPLPARVPRARVTILAIEGDGTGEKPLPDPISFTLQAGIPQEVQGICQGPETAAWIFVLEAAAVRVTSRDCEYPVRGLRPRLRISASP
jgi:hypothetical protein